MKLGVQLFGPNKFYNGNPEQFLSQMKENGYCVMEPCILFEDMPLPVWKAEEIMIHADRVHALGMEFNSFHTFAREFWNKAPEHIDVCEKAGFKTVVLGFRDAFTRENADLFIQHSIAMADALAEHGIALWLHNSWQEIREKIDGISYYEYILRGCKGKLGAQVDTGWVVCGGEDLMDFLHRNEEYVRSIHHKDVASLLNDQNKTDNVPLGTGIVDTKGAFEFGKARGLAQFVDQDFSLNDFMADLKQSAAYLNSLN